MRVSSWVSRSNLRIIFSISLSPNSFFANCSITSSGIATSGNRHNKGTLTEPPLFDLLLSLGKDCKHFDHDLYDYLRHQRAQRDFGIDFEAFEEASDALKQFKESVVARADSFSRLIRLDIRGT